MTGLCSCKSWRSGWWCVGLAVGLLSGCGAGPRWQLRQAQIRTMQMYQQRQGAFATLQQSQQQLGQLAAEKAQSDQMLAQMQQSLEAANQRIANLSNERTQLHQQYKNLLTGLHPSENPLPGSANKRFEELARKYPEFEFDPVTGVSRFNGDLLFASGSDVIRPEGQRLLEEFSAIMNESDARQFDVLVVGHTDDQPISKLGTKSKHPTNWDLSVHRATSVVKQLSQLGIAEPRLGAAGYSMFQQAAPNLDDSSRQLNRRVEIFVLAPDATIAGRDSAAIHR
jgi:chemotaxis protein MotB